MTRQVSCYHDGCGYVWNSKTESKFKTTCPHCGKTVFFSKMERLKMTNQKSENAVSPVIATVLLVAITVILAAVIGAYVFNMSGQTQKSHSLAITAKHVGNDLVLTTQGGESAESVTVNGASYNELAKPGGYATISGGADATLTVVAKFSDGQSQVVYSQTGTGTLATTSPTTEATTIAPTATETPTPTETATPSPTATT